MATANEATWKWDGGLRSRYSADYNTNFANNGKNDHDWHQRAKLGATVAKGENLTGYVSILSGFVWGNDLPSDNENNITAQESNDIAVHEAWVWWKANDMVSVRFGRGALEMAHGLVVSKFDFSQSPYVFDGLMVGLDFNFGTFGLFSVVGEDSRGGTDIYSSDAQTNYNGLSFAMKNNPDWISTVHIHYMNINQDPTNNGAAGAELNNFRGTRYGVALGGNTDFGLDWRADYASRQGNFVDPDGVGEDGDDDIGGAASMYDIEVGYKLANVMNLRFFFNYHNDTGTDTEEMDSEYTRYDGFYYDEHKYAGLMDLFKFGNLNYIALGATLDPMETITVGAQYLIFNRVSTDDTEATSGDIRNGNGGVAGDTNEEKALGNELDLWVEKAYEGGFTIGARYGMFTPGAFFKDEDHANEDHTGTRSQLVVTAGLEF
jgi:hypothetical protein